MKRPTRLETLALRPGEEICILLNDAYDLLSDPDEKKAELKTCKTI